MWVTKPPAGGPDLLLGRYRQRTVYSPAPAPIFDYAVAGIRRKSYSTCRKNCQFVYLVPSCPVEGTGIGQFSV